MMMPIFVLSVVFFNLLFFIARFISLFFFLFSFLCFLL